MGLTPMMQQYLEIKEQVPGAILFYRLGDFYEMFMEDAKIASEILEIALTGRDGGLEERIPMCGVPYHAAGGYISKLTARGFKVAICEQMEDPRLTKGLVKRGVTRIITPGTVLEEGSLQEKENCFLAALWQGASAVSLAVADLSTGQCQAASFPGLEEALEECLRLEVRELVVAEEGLEEAGKAKGLYVTLGNPGEASVEEAEASILKAPGGIPYYHAIVEGVRLLFSYLRHTQKEGLRELPQVSVYHPQGYMVLDAWTRRNLEISRNLRHGGRENTLLWVLDHTRTAAGGRLLKQWLHQPLLDLEEIQRRQDLVEALVKEGSLLEGIRSHLKGVYDLERILGRFAGGSGNPRDALALQATLEKLMSLGAYLSERGGLFASFSASFQGQEGLLELLARSIREDAPLHLREGGIIQEGYDPEVDEYRHLATEGRNLLAELEARERERLGIRTLKVGYNKVFGYYLEISKGQSHLAPEEYVRKQTLAGAERYVNQELKDLEYRLLHASERLYTLEHRLFNQIRERILAERSKLLEMAGEAARLDVLASFGAAALRNHYVRPFLTEGRDYSLREGRHPVVERLLQEEEYIPNDFLLEERNLAVITGPNMAGKSTFIRMLALLAIMAQCGSFVPAESLTLGLADRVFARVGASDDLGSGLSTFMVEMNEVATILREASPRSIIVLDEVGRGTSTLDGLSIAWALSEYLSQRIGARAAFATHYHELIALEEEDPQIFNLSMAVQEYPERVVFLRKVVPGGADKSYGIHVAEMAGLPRELLHRAEEQMAFLEAGNQEATMTPRQLSLPFVETSNPLKEALSEVNPNQLTPLEALTLLYRLKKLAE